LFRLRTLCSRTKHQYQCY